MRQPELLSPAGDLERLRFAIRYGADAVYIGATEFGMRSAPKNFTMEQMHDLSLIHILQPAVKAPVVEEGIPGEVVAAIAASLACMDGGSRYTLRSLKRVKTGRNAWAQAGVASVSYTHLRKAARKRTSIRRRCM